MPAKSGEEFSLCSASTAHNLFTFSGQMHLNFSIQSMLGSMAAIRVELLVVRVILQLYPGVVGFYF